MSKERARRRAEREALQAKARARQFRVDGRRRQRRRLVKTLTPRFGRRGSLVGRRSPGQRAVLVGAGIGLAWAVWYFVPWWPVRIAFWLLLLMLLPLFAVVSFDRKGMRL